MKVDLVVVVDVAVLMRVWMKMKNINEEMKTVWRMIFMSDLSFCEQLTKVGDIQWEHLLGMEQLRMQVKDGGVHVPMVVKMKLHMMIK